MITFTRQRYQHDQANDISSYAFFTYKLSTQQGTYGVGCNSICVCENDGECDPVTGACSCPPGVRGEHCEDGCPPGECDPLQEHTHFRGGTEVSIVRFDALLHGVLREWEWQVFQKCYWALLITIR